MTNKPPITRPASLATRLSSLAALYSPLLSALIFGALATAPLFAQPGFLITRGGGDSPFLLLRLHQLLATAPSGLPARWMPEAAFGYGYPFFSYYAAFPYYLAASFKAYGFSFVDALKLAQLAALLIAAGAMHAWARSAGRSQAQAWLASAAYTFAPFHLVNLYVRGDSLSELWAMSLFPLALWGVQRCVERRTFGRALALAACVALLVVTHNISALNFMPFLTLYGVMSGWAAARETTHRPISGVNDGPSWSRGFRGVRLTQLREFVQPRLRILGTLGTALAWGLALSAFFWMPALLETDYVQIADVTQGYFFYGNHFRGRDLIQASLFFSPETGPDLPTPFSMGLAQAAATLGGLVALVWQSVRARRWAWFNTFLLLGLGVSTYMTTPVSAWAWEHLPLVRFTQFPWRFLSIQALFTAMITAYLAPEVPSRREPILCPGYSGFGRLPDHLVRVMPLAAGIALAVSAMGHLRPDFIALTDRDVTATTLNLLEYFSANIGSTIGYEYLPRGVQPRPYVAETFLGRPPRIKALSGAASGKRIWKRGATQQWAIEVTGGPAVVAAPTHYWPGWMAEADGKRIETRPAEGLGWVAFDLGPGAHVVTLGLGRTPLRAAAETLSLAALLGPLVWTMRPSRNSPVVATLRNAPVGLVALFSGRLKPSLRNHDQLAIWKPLSPFTKVAFRLSAAGLCLMLLGFVALHALPEPPASNLPLSMDLEQLAVPHRDVIHFRGPADLTRVDYYADHLARGDTLTIHTEWYTPSAPFTVTLSLVPQSNLISPVPVNLASDAKHIGEPGNRSISFSLPIPSDIPPGVYFVTVSVTDASGHPLSALTSGLRTRGLVYLAPIWIDDSGPAVPPVAPLADFGATIQAITATTEISGLNTLRVRLLWHALADVPRPYQLSLRLRDVAGGEWAASDSQTAYGYYPTHLWRPGEVIPDFYSLRLPPGIPPGDYVLTFSLYNPVTLDSLGATSITATVTTAALIGDLAPRFQLTPDIALAGVEFPAQITQGDAPEIRASWLTLRAPGVMYRARWALTRPGGEAASQVLDLAPGSPPATWPAEAFILGRVRLGTAPALTPGTYALSVVLVDEHGQTLGEEVVVGSVEVTGRARAFTLPALQTEVGATFGEVLRLWGYNAERSGSDPAAGSEQALKLTLVWGALADPGANYKFFVHLFDPANESITVQVDAMPHDSAYPTALWVAGEVVTDTVVLSLTDVPAGAYRVSVGWYDPNTPTLDRLPAFDAQGQPLDADRVTLPLLVDVP